MKGRKLNFPQKKYQFHVLKKQGSACIQTLEFRIKVLLITSI